MSRKQIFIIAGLVLLAAAFVYLGNFATKPLPPSPISGMDILEKKSAATSVPAVFSPEVPKDAVISKPVSSAPTPTGDGNIFGVYAISASASGFSPNQITVKKGDVVKIEFTAVDGKYDFSLQGYGNYLVAEKGEMKKVSFLPDTIGTFLFTCKDFCPVGKKSQGTLIILPKQ